MEYAYTRYGDQAALDSGLVTELTANSALDFMKYYCRG